MSNFDFLDDEFKPIAQAAKQSEGFARYDPRSTCFYGRRTLELAVYWLYDHDEAFRMPYNEREATLAKLLKDYSFKNNVPQGIQERADFVRKLGNIAVHEKRAINPKESANLLLALYEVLAWLARTYRRDTRELLPVRFNPQLVPPSPQEKVAQSLEQIQTLEQQLASYDEKEREHKKALQEKDSLYLAEIAALKEEIAQNKAHNAQNQPHYDYSIDYSNSSEAATREIIINLMLREAGWHPTDKRVVEYPVTGMRSTASGKGKVDYVLWDDNGKPLALIEAKAASRSAKEGKQQAVEYADCLEQMHGQRPLIFYTNGYDIYFWDDLRYAERKVQGYFTKNELQLMIQRRDSAQELATLPVDTAIVNRAYQLEAIKRITEIFANKERRGLLVMATGTGKTRTAIALVDVLMRANWVKRVLFLADRKTLVKQAVNAFRSHLPSSHPLNLLTDKEAAESRVVVSTYHTMMGQIEEKEEGKRLFGVGHFDLIIVDEAHRSIYKKFGAIFEYFDALLLGLTATPKDEVDRNTYELFSPRTTLPTYAYELEQAILDGHLVEPKRIDISTKFLDEGIRYADLSSEEKEKWAELDWHEGETPEAVSAEQLNTWFYNLDTIDHILRTLMLEGLRVDGGDTLGKTIIFAQNQRHAELIEERFNVHYPHYRGSFARSIHSNEPKAEQLISDFSHRERQPFIAVSVDMLDTGVDIPEVLNLLIFKKVRSPSKFFQMLGRGTRLCPELFGPGQEHDKKEFYVFDACKNFEYFEHTISSSQAKAPESLSQRNFKLRLELMQALEPEVMSHNNKAVDSAQAELLRQELRHSLQHYIQGMDVDNFIVRMQRAAVERFQQEEAWKALEPADVEVLQEKISALPSSQSQPEGQEAKRFDSLILRLQLAFLQQFSDSSTYQNSIMKLAQDLLATKLNVPVVAAALELLEATQQENYWQTIDLLSLEELRLGMRGLLKFLDKEERRIIYSNFQDEARASQHTTTALSLNLEQMQRYRENVEAFVSNHQNDDVIIKIRHGLPLTALDWEKLNALFFSAQAVQSREAFENAYGAIDIGVFIRQTVGMDKDAVEALFVDYLNEQYFNADQINFVRYIIQLMSQEGQLPLPRLFASPFTDIHERSIKGIFSNEQATSLLEIIKGVSSVRPSISDMPRTAPQA